VSSAFKRKRPDGTFTEKYSFHYHDRYGRQKTGIGYTSKKKTEELAAAMQLQERDIKLGYRPAPKSWVEHQKRPYFEVTAEYLAYGSAQGGRGGRPWRPSHYRKRKLALTWWQKQLGLVCLVDLEDCLPRAERVLREYGNGQLTGKTLQNRLEALKAFCTWCVTRGYMAENPLRHSEPFDIEPHSEKRELTDDEIQGLYQVVPWERQLLYETAITTGLRAGELQALDVSDLTDDPAFVLHKSWTKNGRPGLQLIPADLASRLRTLAATGRVQQLYGRNAKRRKVDLPEHPLFFVCTHNSRRFDLDCAAAGIERRNLYGLACFHSLRVTTDSLILRSGATLKDAQQLMRHQDPRLTLIRYGRSKADKLRAIVEQLGDTVRPKTGIVPVSRQHAAKEAI